MSYSLIMRKRNWGPTREVGWGRAAVILAHRAKRSAKCQPQRIVLRLIKELGFGS